MFFSGARILKINANLRTWSSPGSVLGYQCPDLLGRLSNCPETFRFGSHPPVGSSPTAGLTAHDGLSMVPSMIDVVCAVIENPTDGCFLACLRPQGKHLAGLWEFPGGKVDTGESPEGALVREIREELGVEATVGRALEPVVCRYDRGTIRLLPFLCSISGGPPQAIEHEQLLWCAPEDFSSLAWAEADLPILDQLRTLFPKP